MAARTVCNIFLSGCVVNLLWCASSLGETKQDEAAKAEPIKRIMTSKQFEVRQPEKPFCVQFLQDFKTLNGMKFIEPIARADRYDDPAFASFKARCGELPLNERFLCDGRATAGVQWKRDRLLRRQQYLEYCEMFQGSRNFKVFQFDANNNPKDGEELVVYFESARGPLNHPALTTITTDGAYNAFSAKSCTPVGGASSHDPYSHDFRHPVENYSGIVSYRGKYYAFDLYSLIGRGTPIGSDGFPIDPHYRLSVSTFNDDRRDWCVYSTLSIQRAIEENRAKGTANKEGRK